MKFCNFIVFLIIFNSTSANSAHLLDLPYEMILMIASYLPPQDIKNIRETCKHLQIQKQDAKKEIQKGCSVIQCKRKFSTLAGIYKHNIEPSITEKLGKKLYSCHLCDCDCNRMQDFNLHIRKMHTFETYNCFMCPKTYLKEKFFKSHIQTHPGNRPYNCQQCTESFWLENHLLDHIRETHKVILPLYCNICQRPFKTKGSHCQHMNQHHSGKSYPCSFPPCKKVYMSEACYKNHIKNHHVDKPYKCNF